MPASPLAHNGAAEGPPMWSTPRAEMDSRNDGNLAMPPIYADVEPTIRAEGGSTLVPSVTASVASAPGAFFSAPWARKRAVDSEPTMRKLGGGSGSSPMRKLFISAESGATPSARGDSDNGDSQHGENVLWLKNSSFVTCESSRFSDSAT